MSTLVFHTEYAGNLGGNFDTGEGLTRVSGDVAFQSAMEAIALDGYTHYVGNSDRYRGGNYVSWQGTSLEWYILDVFLATAQSAYATFKAANTWDWQPFYTAIVLDV